MAGNDAATIQAVLAGDVDRYAELVDKYPGPSLRLAFSLLGNYEDAKDASQNAFVSAFHGLSRFRGDAKFSTWLYRIILNECKDVYKWRARQPLAMVRVGASHPDDETASLFVDVDDPHAGPSEQLANRELSRTLSAAIRALPMKQQTAFLLHHVHGLSLEETASVMRCRLGTAKSHIFRATEHLQVSLRPWVTEEKR